MPRFPFAKPLPEGTELVAGDDTWYWGPRQVHEHTLLCGKKQSHFPHHCMIGPDWVCMLLTYTLIVSPTVLFVVAMSLGDHWLASLVASLSCMVLLTVYSATACSDPGIIYRPVPPSPMPQGYDVVAPARMVMMPGDVFCGRCEVKRSAGAVHCSTCNLCIEELDHHCPYTGKCIGKKNLKYFYAFLGCLFVHIAFVGLVALSPALRSFL